MMMIMMMKEIILSAHETKPIVGSIQVFKSILTICFTSSLSEKNPSLIILPVRTWVARITARSWNECKSYHCHALINPMSMPIYCPVNPIIPFSNGYIFCFNYSNHSASTVHFSHNTNVTTLQNQLLHTYTFPSHLLLISQALSLSLSPLQNGHC